MKIVIVDDEYFVRMGIKSVVNKKKNDYIIIGEADNGNHAVTVIMKLNPDVVFLDITMPGIDGIQVLKKIREDGYTGYVVMLTCHEDFELARQAMRTGADDYVLKNELCGENLLCYLDGISDKVKNEAEIDGKKEILKQEEQHYYKENFIKNLLQIGGLSREEVLRGFSRYNVSIKPDGIYIINIYIKDWDTIVRRYGDGDIQVFFSAMDHMVEEIFREETQWEKVCMQPYSQYILFTCSKEKSDMELENKIRKYVNSLRYHLEQIMDVEPVISVYRNRYAVNELNRGYKDINELMEQRFFCPDTRIFWNGILNPMENADMEELNIRLEEWDGKEKLTSIIEHFLHSAKNRLIDRKRFLNMIQFEFILAARQWGEKTETDFSECRELKEVMDKIADLDQKIQDKQEDSAHSYLIKQALEIIQENFTKKITLEEVADQLEISAGHFSRMFSAEMGEPFSNYVIRKRIEYARKLITTTNYKFYEIGEICGFSSSVHFNNTFKKLCGMTPNQFRKQF